MSPVVAAAEVPAASAKPAKVEPFSDWDWTWLNGNPRNKDTAFDSKFFTPEVRADITYTNDNHSSPWCKSGFICRKF
jgi:hypothetical protein